MFFMKGGETEHSTIVNQSNPSYGTRIAYHSYDTWNVPWTWTARKSHWTKVELVRPY